MSNTLRESRDSGGFSEIISMARWFSKLTAWCNEVQLGRESFRLAPAPFEKRVIRRVVFALLVAWWEAARRMK